MKKNVCICGGGNLGHVVAGFLANSAAVGSLSLLTNKPSLWSDSLQLTDATNDETRVGHIESISDTAEDVIPKADVVILCLPAFAIQDEIRKIAPHLKKEAFVGCVFCSTGFFFEALAMLPDDIRVWGFQRVPFIARTNEYGHSATLLGYKSEHKIAVEHCSAEEKETFRAWVEEAFCAPTRLLNNYLEASITNSNPLLHTSRLFTMFAHWSEGVTYPKNYLFYEEWTVEAAELYIKMDEELFRLIDRLPVAKDFLQRALPYYESTDAPSLCKKLSSIAGFKGIHSPMKEISAGHWVPDFDSRYFTEDFGYSLRHIWQLANEYHVDTPFIDKVYEWGCTMIKKA